MDRTILRDDQWERIAPLLPGKAGDPGRTAADTRHDKTETSFAVAIHLVSAIVAAR